MPEDQLAVSAYDDGISVIASQTQRRLSNVDVAAAVPTSAEEVDEAIPDGGYGWVCLVAVMLINANTWGVNSAYSVFLAYFLTNDTFPSTSPLVYALVGGLSISQALVVSPLTVYTNRKLGVRATLLIGTALQTVALIGASFASEMWHLILSQGLCFGWGMGFLFVGSASIVPQWFRKRRSLAQGIVSSGAGIGGFVWSLIAGALLPRIGLDWTFRVLAIGSCAFNLVTSILTRDRDAAVQPKQQSFNYHLFARFEFLMLLGWGFVTEFGYVTVYYSLPDFATTIHLTTRQGAVINALLSLGLAVGRPIIGAVSDRVGRVDVAAACTTFCGLLCVLLWVFSRSFAPLAVFAVLSGMVCGTFWATIAPVTAEVVGLRELPDTLATLWLVLAVPTIVAEPIALRLRRSGSGNVYLGTQLFAGFTYLIGAFFIAMILIRRRRTQARDREIKVQNDVELKPLANTTPPAMDLDANGLRQLRMRATPWDQ